VNAGSMSHKKILKWQWLKLCRRMLRRICPLKSCSSNFLIINLQEAGRMSYSSSSLTFAEMRKNDCVNLIITKTDY